LLSQACPRISTKSLFRMHRVPFSGIGGSSVSPIGVLFFVFCSHRCVLWPFSFLRHSSGGMSLFGCVSYEMLYAPSCAAPRDYELPQSFLSRARYRNNSVCQVARKYTQRLYDRDEIRFVVPSHLLWAFPAALRQTISRDVSRTWKPLRTIRSCRYDPIPSGYASSWGFFKGVSLFQTPFVSSASHMLRLKVPDCT